MVKGLIGLGNPLIDIIIDGTDKMLTEFNLKKGHFHGIDTSMIYKFMQTSKYEIFPGDSTANAIVSAAQNGDINVSYIGKIGNDRDGNFYKEELEKHNIKTNLIHGEKPTGMCLAIITKDSERTFAVDLGSSVTLSKEDIINNNLIEEIKKHEIFHFTGYQLSDQPLKDTIMFIIEQLKETDTKISFDCGDPGMVNMNKNLILDLLPNFDIVFANFDEAKNLLGEGDAKELVKKLKEKVITAIVKDGMKGSYIYDDNLHKINAYTVNAKDTTGAGDMYAGTILNAILKKEDLKKAGDRASFLAAEVVKQKGARLLQIPQNE